MKALRNLFRRLGRSPLPPGGTTGELAETAAETAAENRDCWLLVQAAIPRY
jgi:hypothetical protein